MGSERRFLLEMFGSRGGAFALLRANAPRADDGATACERSTIVADADGTNEQPGIPFCLAVHVIDTAHNRAAVGVPVDIWHCNAAGEYSNAGWLRGSQRTNATGTVEFTTIVPGWHPGRATHVYVRVAGETTQLFFPQETIDEIDATVEPYRAHGQNPTTNARDRVFAGETLGETLLTLAGSLDEGFSSTVTIGIPL